MKNVHFKPLHFYFLISLAAMFTACSSSKYTASFQHVPAKSYTAEKPVQLAQPVELPNEILTASTEEEIVSINPTANTEARLAEIDEKVVENAIAAKTSKKLNFVQKLALKKILKKAENAYKKDIKEVKGQDDVAKTNELNANVKYGLILIVAGAIVAIFIPLVGGIVGAVGLVFLLLGLFQM